MSKTTSEVKNRWNAKNYDRITVLVKKGEKEILQRNAKEKGFKSLNEFIIDSIKKNL